MTSRFIKQCALLFVGFMLAGQSVQADIRVISKEAEAAISKETGNVWSCRQKGTRYVLDTDAQGKVTFEKESKVLAQGTFKADKLTLSMENGEIYAYLKFAPDKIKFSQDSTDSLWEFKLNDDKIKVVYGASEYGKVKYYPETKKLKAKNKAGNTEVEFKGADGLSAAAGAYLVSNLDPEKRICLVLILLSMGK